MIHQIQLLSIDINRKNRDLLRKERSFEALIDGVNVTGKVVLRLGKLPYPTSKSGYNFHFDDKTITKHPDYKNIRRQLLLLMIDRNVGMLIASKVVR